MSEFKDLPLHDAVVSSINLVWSEYRITIFLSVFAEMEEVAIPYRLEFHGVKKIEAPHLAAWGDSASINAVNMNAGCFDLEMQSGDVIRIEAAGYKFVAESS